jgi:hypothetical protein
LVRVRFVGSHTHTKKTTGLRQGPAPPAGGGAAGDDDDDGEDRCCSWSPKILEAMRRASSMLDGKTLRIGGKPSAGNGVGGNGDDASSSLAPPSTLAVDDDIDDDDDRTAKVK